MSDAGTLDVEAAREAGRMLREARKARRWTQARLAVKAAVARETIYRIERGRMPTGDVLVRLCDALGADRDIFDLRRRETDHIAMHPDLALLRDRRRARGLTLHDCARLANVSAATLSRFERGMERSRELADFDASGRAVRLRSVGLASALGFSSVGALDTYWRTGKDPEAQAS